MPPRFRADTVCRWHECHGCDAATDWRGRDTALRALREQKLDGSAMDDLRRVAARFDDERLLVQYTDDEVCTLVASLIADGRLRLCGVRQRVYRDEAVVKPKAPPEPKPARRWVDPPPPPPRAPPEDTTFGNSLDAAALARVLKEAARAGLPFCEECEKARLSRERPAASAA